MGRTFFTNVHQCYISFYKETGFVSVVVLSKSNMYRYCDGYTTLISYSLSLVDALNTNENLPVDMTQIRKI